MRAKSMHPRAWNVSLVSLRWINTLLFELKTFTKSWKSSCVAPKNNPLRGACITDYWGIWGERNCWNQWSHITAHCSQVDCNSSLGDIICNTIGICNKKSGQMCHLFPLPPNKTDVWTQLDCIRASTPLLKLMRFWERNRWNGVCIHWKSEKTWRPLSHFEISGCSKMSLETRILEFWDFRIFQDELG